MLKRILISSISIISMGFILEPAMAADSKVPGKLVAQSNSASLSQTEATANLENSPGSNSGINMSRIPISAISKIEDKPKAFTMTLAAERGSDLIAESSAVDKTTTTFMLMPSLKLSENLSSFVRTYIERQENATGNTEVSDTQINLTLKGGKISEEIGTSYSLNGFAPTSQTNRKETRFQGAGGLAVKASGEFKLLSASYALSYRRNVHEYTVSFENKENIRDIIGQSVTVDIPLFQKVSISSLFLYKNSWTYQNHYKQSFNFDVDLNYEAIKDLTFNVGTSNEGSALKANGKDSNVQFYDNKSSVIRAGVTYVL